jgi:hypothetical protein
VLIITQSFPSLMTSGIIGIAWKLYHGLLFLTSWKLVLLFYSLWIIHSTVNP